MQYGKIAILGTILAMCSPAAFATRLYGTITTTGTATVSTTTISFANDVTTKTDPHYDQSAGALNVAGTTGNFAAFNAGATSPSTSLYYVPAATSTTKNTSGQYTGRNPASYRFTTTTATEFYVLVEGSKTLDFYITHVDPTSVHVGTNTPATKGSFTGEGYVTLNGGAMTDGTFTLTNQTTGAGTKLFTLTFVAPTPEPSGLALLGTGMLGAAGMFFRRRRLL